MKRALAGAVMVLALGACTRTVVVKEQAPVCSIWVPTPAGGQRCITWKN